MVAEPAALGLLWGGAGSLISTQYLFWEGVLGIPLPSFLGDERLRVTSWPGRWGLWVGAWEAGLGCLQARAAPLFSLLAQWSICPAQESGQWGWGRA